MSTPAYIYLMLAMFSLGVSSIQHGQPKTGNHSFGLSLVATGIGLGLLYWGGFFATIKP